MRRRGSLLALDRSRVLLDFALHINFPRHRGRHRGRHFRPRAAAVLVLVRESACRKPQDHDSRRACLLRLVRRRA